MQVTFALTATQSFSIAPLMEQWITSTEECQEQPCYNNDQGFTLEGNLLTYSGQRHPLQQDGGLELLAALAGYWSPVGEPFPYYEEWKASRRAAFRAAVEDSWSRLKVVSYETSDKRLAWWETTESRMAARGSLVEWLTTGQGTQEYYAGINRLKGWLQVDASLKTAVKAVFKGASERQLNAAYTSTEITRARAIIKHCRHSGISYFDEWFKESFID
jgi:hypothetical protein